MIVVVARYRHPGQLEYKVHSIFVCEYRDVLGLSDNLIWVVRDDLVKWFDAPVHNSFIRHSTPGILLYSTTYPLGLYFLTLPLE